MSDTSPVTQNVVIGILTTIVVTLVCIMCYWKRKKVCKLIPQMGTTNQDRAVPPEEVPLADAENPPQREPNNCVKEMNGHGAPRDITGDASVSELECNGHGPTRNGTKPLGVAARPTNPAGSCMCLCNGYSHLSYTIKTIVSSCKMIGNGLKTLFALSTVSAATGLRAPVAGINCVVEGDGPIHKGFSDQTSVMRPVTPEICPTPGPQSTEHNTKQGDDLEDEPASDVSRQQRELPQTADGEQTYSKSIDLQHGLGKGF